MKKQTIILPVLLALSVTSIVALLVLTPKRSVETTIAINSTPSLTPILNQALSTTQPTLQTEVPELDTSKWKTYTETGKRYSYMMGLEEDVKTELSGYKKYTFKYPPTWKTVPSGDSGVKVVNPQNNYTITVYYHSNRDYESPEIYTLANGIVVQAFDELGRNKNNVNTLPEEEDLYDIIVEKTEIDWHTVSVRVPITDKQATQFRLEDIAVGRALVKSFDTIP